MRSALLLTICSCVALKPLPKQVLTCESVAARDHFKDLYNTADAALSKSTHDEATSALDVLVATEGEAAACAVADLVQDLEASVSNSTAPAMLTGVVGTHTITPLVKLVRAHAWLASQPFRGSPQLIGRLNSL